MTSVSTIIISGWPAEVAMRERKNVPRYLQGFEYSHCNVKTGCVFAKFDSPEAAQAAAEALSNNPYDMDNESAGGLKADLAKRDLDPAEKPQRPPLGGFGPSPGVGAALHAAPFDARPVGPPGFFPPGRPAFSMPVPLAGGAPVGVDTIAITKVGEQGWTPDQINQVFGGMAGFMVCQYNDRIDGCFVKFSTPRAAQAALQQGVAMGVQSSMAKRSLQLRDQATPNTPYAALDQWSGAAKRPRVDDAPQAGPVDTLVITKLASHGLTADTVTQTFRGMHGFSTTQYNDRIDGCFVKFTDAHSAAQARHQAQGLGLPVEMAKRSFNER